MLDRGTAHERSISSRGGRKDAFFQARSTKGTPHLASSSRPARDAESHAKQIGNTFELSGQGRFECRTIRHSGSVDRSRQSASGHTRGTRSRFGRLRGQFKIDNPLWLKEAKFINGFINTEDQNTGDGVDHLDRGQLTS
jgi:hypothetical protein